MTAGTVSLTAQHLKEVFEDCLFKEGEDTSQHVKAEGVMNTYGFHPERLESHRQEIIEMLADLPDEFQQSKGGGATFLNACMDRHGNQWADLHPTMELLVLLGIAIDKVEFSFPRNVWPSLYGGMPYFVVKDVPESGSEGDKTAKEHLDWCVKRALERYDDGDEIDALASFISGIEEHPGTAAIKEDGMSIFILSKGVKEGRKAFEDAMSGFAVSD